MFMHPEILKSITVTFPMSHFLLLFPFSFTRLLILILAISANTLLLLFIAAGADLTSAAASQNKYRSWKIKLYLLISHSGVVFVSILFILLFFISGLFIVNLENHLARLIKRQLLQWIFIYSNQKKPCRTSVELFNCLIINPKVCNLLVKR